MLLVSKKSYPIKTVTFEAQNGRRLARFWAVDGVRSSEFSLKTFSPEYFECFGQCPFKFDTGKVYFISMTPKGDNARKLFNVMLEPDGKIIEMPFAKQGTQNNIQKFDSVDQKQIKN